MAKVFKIDGQMWRAVEQTTLENDFFVMKQLRVSGIANCTPNPGESAQNYAVRLLYAIVENGVPFELLGGLLLPQGIPDEQWSTEHAETTAAVFRKLTAPEDKAEVQAILISLITDFFIAGLRYLAPSSIASAMETAQPNESETSAAPIAPNS